MDTSSQSGQGTQIWELRERMRQARGVILVEGIIVILCGLFAVGFSPFIASSILILIMGWLAIACGVIMFIRGFTGASESPVMGFINAILIGGLGVLFLVWPFASLEVVTLVLAGWCLLRGLMDVSGFPQRSHVAPGMQFICGIASIVLAVLLVIWWPSDALWAPGLLFGIQLLFAGLVLVATWNSLGDCSVNADPPETTQIA